jgi:hypothetical protein
VYRPGTIGQEVALLDHGEEAVRLWTIMPAAAWEAFRQRGVHRGDGRRVYRPMLPAYRWLMAQMARRIPGYAGRFPVWAWRHPKPDLRRTAHLMPGTPGVRIEYLAPAASVLCSDFEGWHYVLNRWYLTPLGQDWQDWDRRVEAATGNPHAGFDDLPAHLRSEVLRSWEAIFDLAAMQQKWTTQSNEPTAIEIQAVLEEIRLDQIVTVTPFTAR